MHDKGITFSIIVLIAAALLFSTGTYGRIVAYFENGTLLPNGPVACTADAKLCPDGSAVGRTGSDCQFALCPGEVPGSTVEYPVALEDRFVGAPAQVDFDFEPTAEEFRTTLVEAVARGPNFAGHYRVVEWGCGTGCQSFSVVDVRDGRIVAYNIPATYGAHFSLESRLFVTNPQENATALTDPQTSVSATSERYVMEEGDEGELALIATADARTGMPLVCIQMIASAKNLITGETREFPTPCDVPSWWEKI